MYGIDCYRRDRKDAPPVAQYRDVSIDRGEMDRLADRCNRGPVSYTHLDVYKRQGLGYDLVAGANIVGFQRVADAMMAQGIF